MVDDLYKKAIREGVIKENHPVLHLLRLSHVRGRGPAGFSFLGSLLLQSLLSFDFSLVKFLVEGFQSLELKALLSIACDSIGSHALDYYLQHDKVKAADKQLFIDRFIGNFGKVCLPPSSMMFILID
jgi:hypothetical protein